MLLQIAISASLLAAVLVWLLRRCLLHGHRKVDSTHTPRLRLEKPDSTLRVLKNTLDIMRHEARIHDWILAQCERFEGRPWTYSVLGNPPTIVFTDPRVNEDILQRYFWHFEKGPALREAMHDLVGEGLFAVDGDTWAMQRKTASVLFTMRDLRDSMAATVQQHTETLCARLEAHITADAPHERNTFDLFELLNRFTMTTFCSIGFGVDIDCLGLDGKPHPFQAALDRAQHVTRLRMGRPHWFWKIQHWLRVGAEGTLCADIPVIDGIVYHIIHDSLHQQSKAATHSQPNQLQCSDAAAKPKKKKTLVSLFLEHAVRVPGHVSPREVDTKLMRDIVVGFLLAGRDTTAQTLSWCLLSLSQHPHVEEKLNCELAEHLADADTIPSMEQVQRLVYLDAVVHETLRLYPPVPFNWKAAVQDTVLSDGTFVPAGTNAAFPSYALGRMAHVWGADAKQFKPERWIDAATGAIRSESPFKFLAFHAGPRRCLGKHLAMLELKIVLAALLQRFTFEIESCDGDVQYDISLTLPLKKPLRTRVMPRVSVRST